MPYLGEIAALATALCWLGSSLAFAVAGRLVGAQPLNQFRLYAALPMLVLFGLVLVGSGWPMGASAERIWLLVLSGLIGLVLGDYGFFHALAVIGPRLASVIMALWPAMTIGIDAVLFEPPGQRELLGVGVTVVGVTMVLWKSRAGSWRTDLTARQWLLGIVGAVVGAAGQAVGFVIAGVAMQPDAAGEGAVDPLLATIVRLTAATVGMQMVVIAQGQPFAMGRILHNRRALVAALLGALCGPVLGVWLSMVARAHAANAGVAAALMATTPVWMLPVAVWWYRARVGPLGVLGTLLAGVGVAVCLW